MAPQRIGPPAVVVGIGLTGLGMVRSLRDPRNPVSMHVTAVDSDLQQASAYTRLCTKVRCSDVAGNGLVHRLVELARRMPQRPVLLLSQDLAALTVARHQEALSAHYRLSVPTADVTDLLMDKSRFGEYATRHGFDVPRTFSINQTGDLEQAVSGLESPCVLKPVYRNAGWGERGYPKAFVCHTSAELRRAYAQARDVQDRFVAQEWIGGDDSELYFCLAYFDQHSRPVATFTGRKLRQWPPDAGNTSLAEPADVPGVREETVRLFESLKFRGLGSVEFKRDARTCEFKIMEPTVGRANFQSETATANGVNLVWIAYAHLAGLDCAAPVRQRQTAAIWVNEFTDVLSGMRHLRDGDLTLAAWVRSYRGTRRHYAWFSSRDPAPALVMGSRLAVKALRRGLDSIVRRSVYVQRERAPSSAPARFSATPQDRAARPASPS